MSTTGCYLANHQILYVTGTGLSVQIPVVVAGALSSTDDQSITMATVLCMSKHVPDTNSRFTDSFLVFQFISAAYGVRSRGSILNNLLLKNIPKYMEGTHPGGHLCRFKWA
jgi:hypothetical protein